MPPKKYKKEDTGSYTLGMTLTVELLRKRPDLAEAVYVSPAMTESVIQGEMEAICREKNIPLTVSDKVFRTLSPKENCYMIGLFRKFSCTLAESGHHIVLAQPSNAGNLGTIFRTALGLGVEDIAILRPAVDIFDPKSVRATMGALFGGIRFQYYDSFEAYKYAFPSYQGYAFMLDARSEKLQEVRFREPWSLVFGNEATGLDPRFGEICQPVMIPITPDIDSLNLPIAAGIGLYAALGQSEAT